MKSAEQKALQVRLADVTAERQAKLDFIAKEQKDVKRLTQVIKSLKDELEKRQNAEPTVSEHAFLRYFERVEERDLSLIEKSILTDTIIQQIETLNSGSFPLEIDNKSVRLIVKDKTVLTITES